MFRASCSLARLSLTLFLPVTFIGSSGAGELSRALVAALEASSPDERIPVSIIMQRQAGLDLFTKTARRYTDRAQRRRAVANLLRREATAGQQSLQARLVIEARSGRVSKIRSLWLTSVIGAEMPPDLIREIGRRADVQRVNLDRPHEVFLDVGRHGVASLESIECGSALIGAPDVWEQFQIRGEGATVAVIDSGVCYNHPDIRRQIWVNPGEDLDRDGVVMDPDDLNGIDDDHNGFADDLIGWNFNDGNNDPNDTTSHGSHVAGTIAGDGTAGLTAGVAPAARVMVLKVGTDFAAEFDVWSAMQYAADNGAHVMNMSLGWPHEENPDRATWRQNAENAIEMGTAIVVSAGNEGSGHAPDNVRTPGDVPRVITAGATDCDDVLAEFSSRGPVTWQDVPPYNDHPYPPGLIKPDVAAPGVDTTSLSYCSGYTDKSGTSMAAPHATGAVALLFSADPTLSHDEIKTILEQQAIDLGPAGKDNGFGSGRIDAFSAVSAVASPLAFERHEIDDSRPEYGNGDGVIDVEEIVTLSVTLASRGSEAIGGIRARLSTDHRAVEILDTVAEFPDVAPEGLTTSMMPHYTIRLEQGCGQLVRFRLDIEHDDGARSFARFSLRTGLREDAVFLDDDMESDLGWSPGGSETDGAFVRQDPHEVRSGETVIQPEDDHTPSPGQRAWVTGNPVPGSGFDPTDGDVDAVAWVDSPVFDASGGDELWVDFARWVTIGELGLGDTSHYRLEATNDRGASYTPLERLGTSAAAWNEVSLAIGLTPTDGMQLRFYAVDEEFAGTPGDVLVETLVDDVRVRGSRYLCDRFSPPSAQPPNPVGNTLYLTRAGDDTRFDWQAPPADAEHDPATLYRIERSALPDSGFELLRRTTATFHFDATPIEAGKAQFHVVVAVNGGGSSGEEPPP